MTDRILIAYATATGSTLDVAMAIANSLESSGFTVDIKSIQDIEDIEDYHAVIIGSAVQFGTWLPEAVAFVKDAQQRLKELPVALFCVHIQNQGSDVTSRRNRHAYLDVVRRYVNPIDEAFFVGRFSREGAAIMFPKWLSRFIPTTDLIDRRRIRDWTESLIPKLQQTRK